MYAKKSNELTGSDLLLCIFTRNQKQAMTTLPMNEFRRQVGEYVNQTYYAGKSFTLLKGERAVAALVPMALLDRLNELEAYYAQTIEDQNQPASPDTEVDKTHSSPVAP